MFRCKPVKSASNKAEEETSKGDNGNMYSVHCTGAGKHKSEKHCGIIKVSFDFKQRQQFYLNLILISAYDWDSMDLQQLGFLDQNLQKCKDP